MMIFISILLIFLITSMVFLYMACNNSRVDIDNFGGSPSINLFVNYYIDKNKNRQNEIDECFDRNIANGYINNIFIIGTINDLNKLRERMGENQRVKYIQYEKRPTYKYFFHTINTYGAGNINILANSDIFFDNSLSYLLTHNFNGKTCLALSRWDVQKNGMATFVNHSHSQDVWIFSGKIDVANGVGEYTLGVPACDNRIAAELSDNGYKLSNPSLKIKIYHLHLSGIRHYTSKDGLHGKYLYLTATDKL